MRVAPAVGPGRYWLVVERIGWCCAWRKLGDALTGPQHDAPPVGGNAVGSADNKADNKGTSGVIRRPAKTAMRPAGQDGPAPRPQRRQTARSS